MWYRITPVCVPLRVSPYSGTNVVTPFSWMCTMANSYFAPAPYISIASQHPLWHLYLTWCADSHCRKWRPFLGAFAILQKAPLNFVMSVRPHVITRRTIDGCSRNLIFEHFSEICWENPSFFKKWREWPVQVGYYVAELFLEWEAFQATVVEEIKTHIYVR